jgi:hypothetical protein
MLCSVVTPEGSVLSGHPGFACPFPLFRNIHVTHPACLGECLSVMNDVSIYLHVHRVNSLACYY